MLAFPANSKDFNRISEFSIIRRIFFLNCFTESAHILEMEMWNFRPRARVCVRRGACHQRQKSTSATAQQKLTTEMYLLYSKPPPSADEGAILASGGVADRREVRIDGRLASLRARAQASGGLLCAAAAQTATTMGTIITRASRAWSACRSTWPTPSTTAPPRRRRASGTA